MMTIISLHVSSPLPPPGLLAPISSPVPSQDCQLPTKRRGFTTLMECPFSRESYNWIREGCRSNSRIRNKLPSAQVKAIDLCSLYQLQGKGEELRVCSKFDSLYLLHTSVELLSSQIYSVAFLFSIYSNLSLDFLLQTFLLDLYLALLLSNIFQLPTFACNYLSLHGRCPLILEFNEFINEINAQRSHKIISYLSISLLSPIRF